MSWIRPWASAVWRVFGPAAGDFGFVAVAYGEQHVFGEVKIAALFAVVFVDMRFHDGVHGAAFFTEAAENALGEIDVVARGATGAVVALVRFDGDGQRRTYGFAQLARDAALFPVGVAAQGMQPAEPRRGRRLFHRVAQGDLALEEVLARQAHALEQFGQHQAAEEIFDRFHILPQLGASAPNVPGRLHPDRHDDQPHAGQRDENLPAQTHDLVIAVAR